MPRDYSIQRDRQLLFPFGPVRNSELLSNHWLEKRLPLEPEWNECREAAHHVLAELLDLWTTEEDRVALYKNEQSLEYAFIQPVFEALGWTIIYQTSLRGRRPDYALFPDESRQDSALQAGKTSQAFWQFPTLVADAKAWHVKLDRPITVNNQREYPPEQIEWYLNNSLLSYGILTNGSLWRLIPREHAPDQPRFQTYLECDLPRLLKEYGQTEDLEEREGLFQEFLCFYLFFSPLAFHPTGPRAPLIQRAKTGSSEHRLGIGQDLRMRVFEALRLCIEGFLKHGANGLDPSLDLSLCREQSFIFLYRILFVIYAEDRQLLPYRVNRLYTDNRSLGRYRDDIAAKLDRLRRHEAEDFSRDSTAIWEDLRSLFDLIDSGRRNYGVPAYNGGLFDAAANEFLSSKKLSDWHVARVIDQLGRAVDENHPDTGLYRVDYRHLQIQHLGNIYEGLMELHPRIATETMVVIRPRAESRRLEEKTVKASEPLPNRHELTGDVYEPGDVYLLTDKGERRATGSYYTPNHIVDYIVENTLAPLCERIDKELKGEIAAVERQLSEESGKKKAELEELLASLKSDYDDRILRLHILDPAMGSGHFLLRACQYLAEEIATHPYAADPDFDETQAEESALTFWKRRAVERCLYGVDMNPLAVELAKLALWLETVSRQQPLTFLDHHLRNGNSLVGGHIAQLGVLPNVGELLENAFAKQVQEKLPGMLASLEEILALPSDTPEQVKKKESLYRKTFDKARYPLLRVSDYWCSTFYLEPSTKDSERYETILKDIDRPVRFRKMEKLAWFNRAIDRARQSDAVFFHWELEFPDVFLTDTGHQAEKGFDAIIGNPPYDVLSEKEIGHDLSAFKAYIESQSLYDPSRNGKNNLYKLFVCRALQLLADGGRMGFIVQMAILGDKISADIRRAIIEQGAFTAIEAFPQKDDPKRRVFPEAKLSTAIVILAKTTDEAAKNESFPSRVHPANMIEIDSPSLRLTSAEIPLYDASNLSVVSCSQEDWDLVVRFMQSGRLTRLGEISEQFQGEVNETTERKADRISYNSSDGPEVCRGAHICLYAVRDASQGTPVFVKVEPFTDRSGKDAKYTHHRFRRVGFQRKSPQNNFRRLIAAPVPKGTFLLESVSYVPEHHCDVPLEMLLAVMNSKLVDWFFRLGSTNAVISEYQFNNLPFPVFAENKNSVDKEVLLAAAKALKSGDTDKAFKAVEPMLKRPPFSLTVQEIIIGCVRRIIETENRREPISRSERSALHPDAQVYQNLIDRLLYAMAGLSEEEAQGLEDRLERML